MTDPQIREDYEAMKARIVMLETAVRSLHDLVDEYCAREAQGIVDACFPSNRDDSAGVE